MPQTDSPNGQANSVSRGEFHWPRLLLLTAMVVLAVIARLIPHPLNFTPVGAIALFAGATFTSRWLAIGIPMATMIISDAFIGMHSLLPVVYACLLFNVWLGWRVNGRVRTVPVIGSTLLGSVVFFVVTNFACWVTMGTYAKSLSGLTACYVAAIPFFHNTVAGDLFFVGVLFGVLALVERRFPAVRLATSAEPATR